MPVCVLPDPPKLRRLIADLIEMPNERTCLGEGLVYLFSCLAQRGFKMEPGVVIAHLVDTNESNVRSSP